MKQMKTISNLTRLSLVASLTLTSTASFAQRNGPDWNTAAFDVQRTNWMRADNEINSASMAKPGFSFLWKQKIDGVKGGLSAPIMMGTFIGWKGFKDLVLFQSSDGNLYVYDSDLGVPYFDKRFNTSTPKPCAATSIGAPGRPSSLITPAPQGRQSPTAFHSSTGKPGEGIPGGINPPRAGFGAGATIGPAGAPGAPGAPAGQGRGGRNQAAASRPTGLNQAGRSATPFYAITSDGTLHIMAHNSGNEYEKPVPFIPAGSQISDISSVNKFVYVVTLAGCGSTPNTLYAMDRTNPESPVVKQWKADADIVGTPAFSTEGDIYVTAGKSLIALEPKTLATRTVATNGAGFLSTPMIFTAKDKKEYVVAGTADGKVLVMDPATGTVVCSVAAMASTLSTWEDSTGVRYILAADKTKQKGKVMAFKMSGDSLEPAWSSAELDAPGTPIISNGVVFALATGENRASRDPMARAKGKPAVLYAFDGKTGKDLWNSGTSITAPVTTSTLAVGSSMIYFATADNNVYCFGFPQERQ